MADIGNDISALRDRLQRAGQQHVLRFWDQLGADDRAALRAQIEQVALDRLPQLIDRYVRTKPTPDPHEFDRLEPAPYYPRDAADPEKPWDPEAARKAGLALLAAGRVAAVTVAGGQGTRLGYDGPKGCFPGGAVSQKPLFQMFAESLAAAGRVARQLGGPAIPWAIMTSPLNDAPTQAFFREHAFFGLAPEDVMFFQQGTLPSLELETGRLLLAEKGRIATNPDGHGGSIDALHKSGVLARLQERGVEQISYFHVDNPLVRTIDPVFLGLHASAPDSSGLMSSKMLAKANPEEKVGVFCARDGADGKGGRIMIVEYSDLPAELARQRMPDGSLRFIAASPGIHILSAAFVERLATDPGSALPLHRAEKKVPHIDLETGELIEPQGGAPNAVKLEKFVFDALSQAEQSLILETDRTEEFAPIKNARGADSVESSRLIQTERAARWLAARGVEIPRKPGGEPDCLLELRTERVWPELAQPDPPTRIEPGAAMVI
jgi:UDP-N-acetylglucosamine/UDP-N-acetylgalactosamine diphosphorylase